MGEAGVHPLQFEALQSSVDVEFWSELANRKLNELRLSEDPLSLRGFLRASAHVDLAAPLQLERLSFELNSPQQPGSWAVPGTLCTVNTLERFKNFDRARAMTQQTASIWDDILTGAAESDPTLLGRFLLINFADLKLFRMYYWFCFPVLKPPTPITLREDPISLAEAFQPAVLEKVLSALRQWQDGSTGSHGGACGFAPAFLLQILDADGDASVATYPLRDWARASDRGEFLLVTLDTASSKVHPGWGLRNLLLMAAVRWGFPELRVVCLRGRPGIPDPQNSPILSVTLPIIEPGWCTGAGKVPDGVGWELNAKGKLGPRMVDLGPSMDPRNLAESAVDLNLRLMRWRAAPGLSIRQIASTKCLLLGAGTLGCVVARTLMGWGVRNISLVDYGRVAFSNPVRQWLYTFEDCLDGGRPKAQAAATSLAQILPSINAQPLEISVPMPGHPLPSPALLSQAQDSFEKLRRLVEEHDVVFLLMDTRESRWLPTLLAAAAGKLCINAALGFDSYLVMRHGLGPISEDGQERKGRLGCYFCNDVIAPLDSTTDRTMDQMCTVARPGLAPVAGALAVEVMAATVSNPKGAGAPVPGEEENATSEGLPLGPVPHMIRGQLSGFQQTVFTGHAFSQCTACSAAVVSRLKQDGWDFVLQALQDPKSLEDLTGLTELHASTAAMLDGLDKDDEDNGGSAGISKGPAEVASPEDDDAWETL